MASGRHKSTKNAMKYKRDSAFLMEYAKEWGVDIELTTPKFKSLFLNNNQMAMSLSASKKPEYINLATLSLMFIEKHLRLRKITPLIELCDAISNFHYNNKVNSQEALQAYLVTLPNQEQTKLDQLIKNYVKETSDRLLSLQLQSLTINSASPPDVSNLPVLSQVVNNSASASAVDVMFKETGQRNGTWDNEDRLNVSKIMRPAERLCKIIEIVKSAADISRTSMKEPCRQFFKSADAIANCLQNHFGDNSERFLEKYISCSRGKTIFNYSKFERKNCKGKGVSCSLE
jgi:hypothetical protein